MIKCIKGVVNMPSLILLCLHNLCCLDVLKTKGVKFQAYYICSYFLTDGSPHIFKNL